MNAWLLAVVLTVPTGYLSAPVYTRVSENVLKRTGTFLYKPDEEGYTVLFCISQTTVKLRCVVTTPAELMVIVEAQASEQGS